VVDALGEVSDGESSSLFCLFESLYQGFGHLLVFIFLVAVLL